MNCDRGLDEKYAADGFAIIPKIFDPEILKFADAEFDRMLNTDLHEDVVVMRKSSSHSSSDDLIRIENPQLESEIYREIISSTYLGQAIADVCRVNRAQVFFSHVTSLPPSTGGDPKKVGWHQEEQYPDFIDGSFPTVWIPLCTVGEDNGALRYVKASHQYGVFPERGITSTDTHEEQRQKIVNHLGLPNWNEVPAVGRAGLVSIHHSRTIHGTFPNQLRRSRRAIVAHICTEENSFSNSKNAMYQRYVEEFIHDPKMSPVIFER